METNSCIYKCIVLGCGVGCLLTSSLQTILDYTGVKKVKNVSLVAIFVYLSQTQVGDPGLQYTFIRTQGAILCYGKCLLLFK